MSAVMQENRQDLSVAWNVCSIRFDLAGDWNGWEWDGVQLRTFLGGLEWPRNWKVAEVEVFNMHQPGVYVWFHVSAPPRAADGAFVRAKLNMIPKRRPPDGN